MKKILPPANLDERRERTEKVLGKFRPRAIDFTQRITCIHLLHAQAKAMGMVVPPMPQFRSVLGARRELARRGAASVIELVDQYLPGRRIPPSCMWLGDAAALPGEDGFDALLISAGGKLLGWHESTPGRMVAIELSRAEIAEHVVAWRLG
jgi:hypothetical protein